MTSLPHLPTMDWDYTDHLRHISRAPASRGTDPDDCLDSSLEAWYRYDAAKQRTRKRVKKQGGLVEERFYLGGLEWYRRTLNGALVEEIETLHLFDGEHRLLMVDQVIKTDRTTLGIRDLYRYTLSNHLGSSTVEVNENADIISYEEYHPYGTTAYQSGRNAAEVKLKRYRYTGMERDEESGLGYHGARYYPPWLGRWVSCDPAGLADGANIYAYAHNAPTTGVDPTGYAVYRIDDVFRPDQSHWINLPEFEGMPDFFPLSGNPTGRTATRVDPPSTEAELSPPPLVQADPITPKPPSTEETEAELSPPPLVQADPKPKPPFPKPKPEPPIPSPESPVPQKRREPVKAEKEPLWDVPESVTK